MDHPILSITEFAEHFRRKAQELGYEDYELLEMEPLQSMRWDHARSAFGVVISGDAVVGNEVYSVARGSCEEFEVRGADGLNVLAGSDGARIFVARSLTADPACAAGHRP